MDGAIPVPSILPDLSKLGQAARRTSSSFSEFTNRLIEADVATALTSVVTNIYVARFTISLLVIIFGIVTSVLYVKYTNQGNAKKQEQLKYINFLWFGKEDSGLIWLLVKIWLSSAMFLVGAPLIFKVFEVWRK